MCSASLNIFVSHGIECRAHRTRESGDREKPREFVVSARRSLLCGGGGGGGTVRVSRNAFAVHSIVIIATTTKTAAAIIAHHPHVFDCIVIDISVSVCIFLLCSGVCNAASRANAARRIRCVGRIPIARARSMSTCVHTKNTNQPTTPPPQRSAATFDWQCSSHRTRTHTHTHKNRAPQNATCILNG